MISICIPAYKHVALVHEAAQSILQQDADIELIILDDFYLVDPTVENLRAIDFLRSYLHKDIRVKCVSNKNLLTIQDNWNKAVSLCTGRYVKLIGADDRMLPGSLEKMQQMIRRSPKVAFHGHLANVINIEGSIIKQQMPYAENFVNREMVGSVALRGKIRQQVRFKEPACNFYLKRAWEAVSGYEKKFRFTFDIHFNVKMMSSVHSILWNEYLVDLRRHQSSDGALLPASMALADLKGVASEILDAIGEEVTLSDKAALNGWIEYRMIELVAQRYKRLPLDTIKLIANNLGIFSCNPLALYWMSKLLVNRVVYGDLQQY